MGSDPDLERAIAGHLAGGRFEMAATAIVRGYGPQLLGYLRALLPHDGDEAFSTFCELMWAGLPGFRRQSTVLTWSYQVAWSAARRLIEDPYRRRGEQLTTGATEALMQEVRSTTAMHLKPETAQHLDALRAQLDGEEQTLLVLRIDRDMAWSDIARVLSDDDSAASAARLRKRFERLVQKIRTLAKQRGILP